jgi:hypothetical protein
MLDGAPARAAAYRPWWAARAHALRMGGDPANAAATFARTEALAACPALHAFHAARRAEAEAAAPPPQA